MTNGVEPRPLRGTIVALVTPFREDGALDEAAIETMVDFVIEGGVEGILVCGSTGEKSTLNDDEHKHMIERVLARVNRRVAVMAETGSNDTQHACMMARFAREAGADAALSVVPYYNRPTQEGLTRHYLKIAESGELPIIIYNIPPRTAVKMNAETILRLAEKCEWIRGVKDAVKDLDFTAELLRGRPQGFRVLSGDDTGTLANVAMGGDGIISVIANEVPGEFSNMVRHALAGDFARARDIFYRLLPLMMANFIETNPIPVKAALAMMGKIKEEYRLPLCPMSNTNRQRLRIVLVELGLIPQ